MSKRNDSKPCLAAMESVHLGERRERRYSFPFEIEVMGIDGDGKVFRQRLFTRNVSEWGLGFVSRFELKRDDIIAVRLVGADEKAPQARFQVVRSEREGEGWAIGAWKMSSNDVWGMELEKVAKPQEGEISLRRLEAGSNGLSEEGNK